VVAVVAVVVVYLSVYHSVCLFMSVSAHLPIHLSDYVFIYLSICLSASLKRDKIKTKQFCETSSISEDGNNKTRRRMARERRGAGSSVVSIETLYYKTKN